MKKRILILIGTRPEAIKMAPVIRQLNSNNKFDVKVCASGQHTKLVEQIANFFVFNIDIYLDTMEEGQPLNSLSSKILGQIEAVLSDFKPDLLLVHGDTTTTLIGGIAAYNKKIKLGHIEAGLRTGNKFLPWPEEGNRKIVSVISDIHFAPTQLAYANLIKEVHTQSQIVITGNTVIDALFWARNKILQNKVDQRGFADGFKYLNPEKKVILVTCHRRENHGVGIKNICSSIKALTSKYSNIQFVLPVHPNPAVKNPIFEELYECDDIHLIKPLDYMKFVELMELSHIILTDSGGLQEEAPSLGKPVLLLRTETERPEAIESGSVKLIGTDVENIILEVSQLLENEDSYQMMSRAKNPFGEGNAAKIIENYLEEYL